MNEPLKRLSMRLGLSIGCALLSFVVYAAEPAVGTPSSSTSIKDKKPMDTKQQTAKAAVPVMSAEEISHRMLDLIANLKTADYISFKNLEIATGLKVYQDADNPNRYMTGAKITDTWFFNITVISGVTTGERSRLIFSFDDQTDSSASMTPICQVDFNAYKKRLTELGFQSKPYYAEHNRLISWDFTRDKVYIGISIRGENKEKVSHDCVSMIELSI